MKQLLMGVIAIGGIPVVLSLAGCATGSEFKQKTEPSRVAIYKAEEMGATKVPGAAIYLQLARDEMEKAKTLAASNRKPEALSLMMRAEADAELAAALTQEDSEKKQAAEALGKVREFRKTNKLPTPEKSPDASPADEGSDQ